jgi:hypothetical protein
LSHPPALFFATRSRGYDVPNFSTVGGAIEFFDLSKPMAQLSHEQSNFTQKSIVRFVSDAAVNLAEAG